MTDLPEIPQESEERTVLAFDSDDPEFMRGVEVGINFMLVQLSDLPINVVAHWNNAEMMLRIAEASGVSIVSQDVNEEFMVVTFDHWPEDTLDDDV